MADKSKDTPPTFYSDFFSDEEHGLAAAGAGDLAVDDEVWLQRVVNRRLFEHSTGEAEVDRLLKVTRVLAAGTGRVASLLRDRRALSGEAADSILGAVTKVLDELTTELGRKL